MSEHVDVETPELVVLSYTVAGIGSRAGAAVIDFLICGILRILVFVGVFAILPDAGLRSAGSTMAWFMAIMIIVYFFTDWAYYVLFEALSDGQTPGKRVMRLRVVRDGGYAVNFSASAIRNLVRIVDMQPGFFYGVGMTSLLLSRQAKRLGDMAGGTLVVHEGGAKRQTAASAPAQVTNEPIPMHTVLTDAEYSVLDRFVARAPELDPARRRAFVDQLATRFAAALQDVEGTTASEQLAHLHATERAARARGVAHRSDTGAARERHAIIAAGSSRWATFATRLAPAQTGGIAAMTESDARDFVREYREVTGDLARLRTATRGGDGGEVFYLNRLAAGAHNLLYRRANIAWREVINFMFVAVPREIRASYIPVFLAAVMLFGPMAIAYTAVVRDPAAAELLLPPAMMERADEGVQRAASGDGYIDDPGMLRPVMATSIIANNVQVSFFAFAGGITAGVLTGGVLLSNGVSIGAFFGLYASKGIGSLLLAFIAPHGVLELTAICIAGGAGFLLAAALLIPGARTRRAALADNARRAIKLVAGSAMLLVVAGLLEGLVSPIPWWPLAGKLAVSGTTAVLLYVYLRLAIVRSPRAP
jgi:uncharacterized membrane protein SpoIIM required for sporulation/uncharacterized RDD family membrane protein YckC